MFRVPLTLVLPLDVDAATGAVRRVLLGYKKRGFGQDKWNGFGGKLEAGESVAAAAVRELHEESGLTTTIDALRFRGVNDFEFEGERKVLQVFVFETSSFTGIPTESDEMRPAWFDVGALPYERMWVDDRLWLPLLLADRGPACFVGEYVFRGHETILAQRVRVLDGGDEHEAHAALDRVARGTDVNDAWPVPSATGLRW